MMFEKAYFIFLSKIVIKKTLPQQPKAARRGRRCHPWRASHAAAKLTNSKK
jgi:hypothetical protein